MDKSEETLIQEKNILIEKIEKATTLGISLPYCKGQLDDVKRKLEEISKEKARNATQQTIDNAREKSKAETQVETRDEEDIETDKNKTTEENNEPQKDVKTEIKPTNTKDSPQLQSKKTETDGRKKRREWR